MRRIFAWLRTFLKNGDLLLLALCLLTAGFGLVVIASATAHMGSNRYLLVQGGAIVLGVALYIAVTLIDIDLIAEQRTLLTIFNTVFIGMLLIWGVEGTTGNRSWLQFRFLPFNIQPAEICKLPFILILAKTMSIYKERVSGLRCVSRLTLHTLFIVGLIVVISKDAGVALPFVFIMLVMAYLGGVRLWWFAGALAAAAAAFPLLWQFVMRQDQKNRILMIFDPTIDPQGLGVRYQTNLSIRALSAGGLSGQGLFHGGTIQSGNLPAQHTDFIFSAIGNELGMLGCIAVLLLLSAIIVRCIVIGARSGNYQNRLICYGVAAMLIFQIASNVGMCLGILPVIGLTLPFISYGGSSLVTMFAAVGIISSIKCHPAGDSPVRYISPYM